jgi:ABC-type sugar transport system substrate-binding protein
MCVGVVQAMKAMGKTGDDIKVVSYNGSKAGADMVKAGEIVGTAVQPLAQEGSVSLQAAVDAANGKPVEAWYKDVIEPITKDNVDSYDPSLLW